MIEVDPLAFLLYINIVEGPNALTVTESDVFAATDDDMSPVDILDPYACSYHRCFIRMILMSVDSAFNPLILCKCVTLL